MFARLVLHDLDIRRADLGGTIFGDVEKVIPLLLGDGSIVGHAVR